jgi:putative RNA 2'-phosphotransferase
VKPPGAAQREEYTGPLERILPEVADFARDLEAGGSPLVRVLAFLLRHGGPAHGVAVDAEGWAELADVARALRWKCQSRRGLRIRQIEELVGGQELQRFELRRGKIRALYGHTLPGVVAARPAAAPPRLFHGTSAAAEPAIRREGLRPMGRSYVHLTSDLGYALQVARAASASWVVLRVRAAEAEGAGTRFLTTAGHVWLSGAIGPEFIDPIPVALG